MDIKEYIKNYNLTFDQVKTNFAEDYAFVYQNEKDWLINLEDKTHLLIDSVSRQQVEEVIYKLKNKILFNENDTEILSTFVSKINTIVKIADRINNYKEGTLLANGKELSLSDFFNTVTLSNSFHTCELILNDNLNKFFPHIYSVIKHCQYPNQYPIYYKFWKNILREVLSKDDDYDTMCNIYNSFPIENRHLNFAVYFGTIGIQIAKNISQLDIKLTKDSKEYKYITNDILNLERYTTILDNSIGILFELVKSKFQPSIFDNYINILRNIIDELKIQPNDPRVVFSAREDRLIFTVGQRYCFNLYASDSRGVYGVISKTKLSDTSELFEGITPQPFYNYIKEFNPNPTEWESVIESIKSELSRTSKSGYKKYNNEDFENYLFSDVKGRKSIYNSLRKKLENVGFIFESEQKPQRQKRTETELKFVHPSLINKFESDGFSTQAKKFYIKPLSDSPNCEIGFITGRSSPLFHGQQFSDSNALDEYNNNPAWINIDNNPALDDLLKSISSYLNNTKIDMKFPLNTILYGPPGTGKTFHTIIRAAQIIENRSITSYEEALNIFKKNLHNRIEFITFHQNYSYEDFIQGLRPEIENSTSLTFEKKDGVFKKIADKALMNYITSENPAQAKIDFDNVFHELIQPLSEGAIDEIEIKMKKSAFYITEVGEKSIEFRKNIGESKHSLSINTLRKMYDRERNDIILGGLQPYYNPILELLIANGKSKVINTTRQNYVIIIDEINRANISRVFGELITLIEPDKRSHGEIPLEAKLPSGDIFIVPSNLYIIGTMNTADKSIALLDIALRRRFEFESMYPVYKIDDVEIYDNDILLKINEQIIKSKGHDFQIGHAYFMGENKDLIQRMNKKVIPLLLEYFMNDEKEVKGILFNAGLQVDENSWPIKISGRRA